MPRYEFAERTEPEELWEMVERARAAERVGWRHAKTDQWADAFLGRVQKAGRVASRLVHAIEKDGS